ncbi:hypothetical protein DIPPA_70192 [Diplonema papillatum]|uniref:fructose-bisphosphatase n=1 Tax=Diplonema papillatum TaxID=91374 RepID=A0A0B6VU02_9EUGL|nr:hypothetical protein DIPPA_70192 [Diplonema papillatum]BAQ25447.1 fructose-1,6-bisphosphatase [Diplonema papillatum]
MKETVLALQDAVREIAHLMRVGSIAEDFGEKHGKQNESGDHQETVDVAADLAVSKRLMNCSEVHAFASEEREAITVTEGGKYLVAYDPLDGSQNIAVNITTGLIFGIFSCSSKLPADGRSIIGAGYALFGAATQFVLATEESGVTIFTLDPTSKEFKVTSARHRIPQRGKVYACNEGLHSKWVEQRSKRWAETMRGRSVRWMACMVSDAHRILLNGGGFLLPADRSNTKGKLRLLYEAYPMAYVFECAGGHATDEHNTCILDLPFPPASPAKVLHMKVPVFLAGPYEAELYAKL